MRVVSKFLVLLAIFCLMGCASWQKTTRMAVAGFAQATEVAGDEGMKYFQVACSNAAAKSAHDNCDLTSDLSRPECVEIKNCLSQMTRVKDGLISTFRILKLALIAVDLSDKDTALSYLEKGMAAAKEVYKPN
jgi:hypothetical protein